MAPTLFTAETTYVVSDVYPTPPGPENQSMLPRGDPRVIRTLMPVLNKPKNSRAPLESLRLSIATLFIQVTGEKREHIGQVSDNHPRDSYQRNGPERIGMGAFHPLTDPFAAFCLKNDNFELLIAPKGKNGTFRDLKQSE